MEKIGIGNEKAINTLTKLLNSKYVTGNESCLHKVIMTLKQICTGEESNINALLTFLESQDKHRDSLTQMIQKLKIRNRDDKQIINILVSMIEPQDMYEYNHYQIEENLDEVQNSTVIDTLVELLYSMDDHTLTLAAKSLEKIDPSNEKAFETLIKIPDLANKNDGIYLLVLDTLKSILQPNQFTIVVAKLTSNLNSSQSSNYNFYKDILWYCAQNMPYRDFYQAWHQHNVATRAMRSLKKILFTRII